MSKPRIDITGERYGRLLVVSYLGTKRISGKLRGMWECLCDCGNVVERTTMGLRHSKIKSCGCAQRDAAREQCLTFRTHGLSSTKEYTTWANMVARATNPKTPEYDIYGPRGIHEPWVSSFSMFIEHIGMMPSGTCKYTLERIDNTVGYFPGNVKWLDQSLQSRNQSQRKDNKSGVTGVCFATKFGRDYWVASWSDQNKQIIRKSFSISKLGNDLAFNSAVEYRSKMLLELQDLGIYYSPYHGIPRNSIDK